MLDSWPHLLVPIDFRPACRAALRVALELTTGAPARVTLLHVTEGPLSDLDAIRYLHRASRWLHSPGDPTARAAGALRHLARELRPELQRSVAISTAVRSGDVATEVVRLAAEAKADRIVVGVNGLGWRLSLRPRRSKQIARLSDRTVLLVHPSRGPMSEGQT